MHPYVRGYNGTMVLSFSRGWPALILSAMFALMLASSFGDSGTMDELAHIPAGYSYVKFQDFRLNPEHPPLVKALAGAPLLFLDLNYPMGDRSWTEDVNGQWAQGAKFLYESGNDPDRIIFWARLPMVLLTLLFGALLYIWVRKRFGNGTAIFVLLFFAFSPTILAHGRYVTTDIGAAFGFFIGIAAFIQFLEEPTWKRTLLAGTALGIALLLKFSTFLLLPIYGLFFFGWMFARWHGEKSSSAKISYALHLIAKIATAGLAALLIVWVVYGFFTLHYPPSRQLSDSQFLLSSFGNRTLAGIQEALIENPITRPIAHYLLGLLMVVQRASGGNLNYFLGEVTNAGARLYFPFLYLVKEPLPLHILTLIALFFSMRRLAAAREWSTARIALWIRENFVIYCSIVFVLFYWVYTIRSPLNIGIRHIIPTLPFIYLLVSHGVMQWLRSRPIAAPRSIKELPSALYRAFIALPRYLLFAALMLWLVLGAIGAFPHFLPYYNALAGGAKEGWKIAVDSNYDWGQDLKRLKQLTDRRGFETIHLDYFGAGSPRTEFGDRFVEWNPAKGRPPAGSYFAVSATFMQNNLGRAKPDVQRTPGQSYEWLRGLEPFERAGYSIFVFKIP